MLKYHIWTIGCQMNKAESERLGSLLEKQDYQATDTAEEADLILLNSCVVRESAESRVINRIHSLKPFKKAHPNSVLAVTGCLVNSEIDQLKKNFPHVDYFFKAGDCPPWVERTQSNSTLPQHPPPAVFVPIMQGCDNFCSYCIVPYRRGREKSRTIEEIVCEVEELVHRSAKEVTLLGQNVNSYGHDLPNQPDLADLLAELNTIVELKRIRFLTNHPKDMNAKLIKTIASLDKVCKQICLPIQSGNDEILKAMRRGYTKEQYRQLIRQIRNAIPGVALSTDVIVGFPAESPGQFQETVDLLSEIKFDTVHVAVYSSRSGTLADREFEDNIPLPEKKRRLSEVEQLQEKIAIGINAQLLGKTIEILVEGKAKDKWQGRTRTDKLVFFNDDSDYLGQLVKIRIRRTSPWSLQGEVKSSDTNKEEK
ncbi:tRNA (N6-isopentenyl adenosine(37)-C2)-methylthiotransferase MiaB [Chloroflexota bacterium]